MKHTKRTVTLALCGIGLAGCSAWAQEAGKPDNALTCKAAEEVAAHADTIAWEVMTSISRRVPRFYREP